MRHALLSVLPCAFLGIVAALEGVASAQDPHGLAGSQETSTAEDLLRRARQARDARRWAEAEAAYEAALKAADAAWTTDAERAEIAAELGLCELALGSYRDAADHLAQSLRHRGALRSPLVERAEDGLLKAESRVVTLYLGVSPPDAEVFVDGKALGRQAPTYELFLEPGQHTVRARLDGHSEAVGTFDGQAGKASSLTLKLPRAPERAAPPGAASAGPVRPEAPSPPPAARRALPLMELRIGGAALATAGLAAGTVFLLRADVIDGNLAERDMVRRRQGWTPTTCWWPNAPSPCAEIRKEVAERGRFATLGNVALVTGAVFGIATAASFLVEGWLLGSTPAREGVHVIPSATGTQAGLVLLGVW
ncbi:PEGA domain-containing protein [Sorangium atrum]|uniref:PEGA domain-containing protein n=1 Tax=Sorangium atrum TaxID=2995308 RepID=A0ABT5BXN7_9BACT|nr:PEGA domain-containing protein [Sorangium aterium]MDC0678852.1 PEGA domain-containing protein [Sorangium aterium]